MQILVKDLSSRGSQWNAIVCVSGVWGNNDEAQSVYELGLIAVDQLTLLISSSFYFSLIYFPALPCFIFLQIHCRYHVHCVPCCYLDYCNDLSGSKSLDIKGITTCSHLPPLLQQHVKCLRGNLFEKAAPASSLFLVAISSWIWVEGRRGVRVGADV